MTSDRQHHVHIDLDNPNERMLVIDASGCIIKTSPALDSLLKYDTGELQGKSFIQLVHKDLRIQECISAAGLYHFQRSSSLPMEIQLVDKAGKLIPVRMRSILVRDDAGVIMQALGFIETLEPAKEAQLLKQKVREAEETLTNMIDCSGDAILIISPNGQITLANKAFCDILGYAEAEILGKHLIDISPIGGTYHTTTGESTSITDEYINYQIQKATELFEKDIITNYELYLLCKDDRLVPVEATLSVLKNEQGERRGSIAICRDITERTIKDTAIKATRDFLENIFKMSAEGLIVVDKQGSITMANSAFEKTIGYARDEIVKMTVSELSPSDDESVARDLQFIETLFRYGIIVGFENRWLRKDGSPVDVEINASLLKDAANNVTGTVASIRDITDRKEKERVLKVMNQELLAQQQQLRAANQQLLAANQQLLDSEQKLRESEARYQNLIGFANVGIIVTENSAIVELNKKAEEMYGYSRYELIGKPPGFLTMDKYKKQHQEMFSEYLRCGKSKKMLFEEEGVRKDGSNFPIEISFSFSRPWEKGSLSIVAIIRDTTESKRSEALLRAALEKAEAATQAKSMFLANMSHEIRTPMNGVIGFTEMLLETELGPEQRDDVMTIKQSGEILLALINNILDFSKLEAGKIELEEIEFDIEMLAYDVCGLIRPRLRTKEVQLLCSIDDNLPALVKGDPHRIRQVIINLLGNAVKFTQKGEIELGLDVDGEEQGRILVHTRVRDTGIGIAADKRNSIFEIFQQADGATERRYGGTGLGLSICKNIARLMGGDVWVESGLGKGSIFHFTAWFKLSEIYQTRRIKPPALTAKSVLIIDNSVASLEVMRSMLKSAGMYTACFPDIDGAVQALGESRASGCPFDLCIIDIVTSEQNGNDLFNRLRRAAGDIPLLACSSVFSKRAKEYEQAGFSGYLPKPISRKRLIKMIERLLGETTEKAGAGGREPRIITQHSIVEETKHSISILLAEDNPVNQKLTSMLLNKAGYHVDLAVNGKEAVDLYAAQPQKYDVILMDVQMPEMDGLEATRRLRDMGYKEIPIIAMTANALKGDREKCLAAGMNDYVSKPVKREVVFEKLKKWLIEKR